MCVQNLFVKKNEKFKTALLTSFILLLTTSHTTVSFTGWPLVPTALNGINIINIPSSPPPQPLPQNESEDENFPKSGIDEKSVSTW